MSFIHSVNLAVPGCRRVIPTYRINGRAFKSPETVRFNLDSARPEVHPLGECSPSRPEAIQPSSQHHLRPEGEPSWNVTAVCCDRTAVIRIRRILVWFWAFRIRYLDLELELPMALLGPLRECLHPAVFYTSILAPIFSPSRCESPVQLCVFWMPLWNRAHLSHFSFHLIPVPCYLITGFDHSVGEEVAPHLQSAHLWSQVHRVVSTPGCSSCVRS